MYKKYSAHTLFLIPDDLVISGYVTPSTVVLKLVFGTSGACSTSSDF